MRSPIAALAMYDWPEASWANDALWAYLSRFLSGRGIDAPAELLRERHYHEAWRSPDLLLAQTCGYPYAVQLRGAVQLVATPAYACDGCEAATYCSLIIARRDGGLQSLRDIAAATAAINSAHSQSGHWALRAAIAADPQAMPPARAILSGGHRQSLAMVADGTADIACIDAVCWALALRHEPAVAKLRVIERSPAAPGLPLISARITSATTIAALRAGLQAMLAEPDLSEARAAVFLRSIEVLPESTYDRILDLKRLALTKAFPSLEERP